MTKVRDLLRRQRMVVELAQTGCKTNSQLKRLKEKVGWRSLDGNLTRIQIQEIRRLVKEETTGSMCLTITTSGNIRTVSTTQTPSTIKLEPQTPSITKVEPQMHSIIKVEPQTPSPSPPKDQFY